MEVEMDVSGVHHHYHHQEMSSLESMLCNKASQQQDKKPKPPEDALKCPRCDSGNTKFCYYNNYSLTQPRYFCKSCRRYWTKGGTLRNVPVGGGCRKNNKRSSSSSSTTSTPSLSSATSPLNSSSLSKNFRGPQLDQHLIQQNHHHPLNIIASNANNHLLSGLGHLPYDSTDLSLAFARLQGQANGHHMGFDQFDHSDSTNSNTNLGFLDGIRGGFLENTLSGFHNVLYSGGSIGNGEMGSVGNLMGLNNGNRNHGQDQEIMNPMFHDHQENMMNSTCSGTTAVTMTTVKQETCNMMRSSEFGENRSGGGGGVLWGFPWQIGGGDQGNMVQDVESGRSQIGGWNGIGSTAWHGLIDSPLM